ncbi:MAG: PQQ-dependent sugar dehydrogenase [Pyrinomonadaceae bacterium]
MSRLLLVKLIIAVLFVAGGGALLLTNNFVNRRVEARSSGPDPGFTGAPGEFRCDECHVFDGAPTGGISIVTPQTYVPGQTYRITVNETNGDSLRRRWGFQLTALDDSGERAGTLQSGGDGRTQIISGTIGVAERQYAEHTSAGTYDGQQNGASWTFNWTAPSPDVGTVTFYTAGNQANGDGSTSGDSINFTFSSVPPAAAPGDFAINITPTTQTILPGASGTYTVIVTPANNFTGTVNLSLAGLPAGASATFNPASVNIIDASARTSTLTVTAGTNTPFGNVAFNVNGASGNLQHAASATLLTGPTLLDEGLNVRLLVGNLNQPTTLAFIGHNDFLILERATGKVLRVRDGAVQGAPALDLAVNSASERGLLGIALHPDFHANARVYLFWTESGTGIDTINPDEVALLGNRVDSYLWNGTTLAPEKNLIKLRALQQDAGQPSRGNHNGGIIRFGPDGKLYIVVGDNGRRGLMQNLPFGPSFNPQGPLLADDQFGGPEPDDAHLTGVILRLNDDGTTPTDNPFFNAATNLTGEAAANVKKVFAYGIRNSFGMAFDPISGQLWTQENGDDSFDEINRVVPGFNGGWIQLMGPSSRVSEFKAIELGRSGGLQQNRWPPELIADTPTQALARLFQLPGARYTEPEFSWKYAVAPSPIGFVRGRALGTRNEGALVVGASRATLLGGYLFRFQLAGDRRKFSFTDARLADLVADNAAKFDQTESESLLLARDFGITTDIESAPDGNLYVVSLSHGAVYEISAKPATLQFSAATAQVAEGGANVSVTVTRGGDASGSIAVDYRTIDDPRAVRCDDNTTAPGVAFARCDYATSAGTLMFAPNETSKTFTIALINDAHPEQTETIRLELFDPAGATLGAQETTTLSITDNDTANTANPIFDHMFFVRQQYLDFLAREPEAAGLAAWLNVLNNCSDANTDAACDRTVVSASFFRSTEFQLKGYFVYLFYKVSLGRLPLYAEIVPDMASVTGATAAEVFAKRDAFANRWLMRADFKTLYPATLAPAQYVDKLLQTAGVTLSGMVRRETLIDDLQAGRRTRAEVLRAIVEHPSVDTREYNGAFVAMQYFGYLRRDPEAQGYRNWLDYLNANPADFRTMVRGFLYSTEYHLRFGKP